MVATAALAPLGTTTAATAGTATATTVATTTAVDIAGDRRAGVGRPTDARVTAVIKVFAVSAGVRIRHRPIGARGVHIVGRSRPSRSAFTSKNGSQVTKARRIASDLIHGEHIAHAEHRHARRRCQQMWPLRPADSVACRVPVGYATLLPNCVTHFLQFRFVLRLAARNRHPAPTAPSTKLAAHLFVPNMKHSPLSSPLLRASGVLVQ